MAAVANAQTPGEKFWSKLPAWGGKWKSSPEIAKWVGSDSTKFPETIRFEFLINKKAALDVHGQKVIDEITTRTEKMSHKVIAVGSWKVNKAFDKFADRDSVLFVTQKAGTTFVWLGTPTNSASFAEVHFVRGKKPENDLLMLDFGMSNNWKRIKGFSGNAAGFKRDE